MTRSLAVAVAIAAWLAEPVAAESSWQYEEQANGRRVAYVQCEGKGPNGPFDATLVLSRSAGAARKPITKDGVTTPPLVVELCLHDAKAAAPFPVEDFEGPDAPASRSKLTNVRVTGTGKEWSREFVASGWYSNRSAVLNPARASDSKPAASEPMAFVFGLGDVIRDHRGLLEMADKLAAGASAMTVQINPHGAKGDPLKFEVVTSGAGEVLKKLLEDR